MVNVAPLTLHSSESVYGISRARSDRIEGFGLEHTKVGRYAGGVSDFSRELIVRSVDASLRRLGLEYVDTTQCHDIDFVPLDQIVEEALPTLRRLQEAGKIRFVGITGFPLIVYQYVMDQADVDTVLSFCHYTLNDTSPEILVPYLKQRRVGIINASPR